MIFDGESNGVIVGVGVFVKVLEDFRVCYFSYVVCIYFGICCVVFCG